MNKSRKKNKITFLLSPIHKRKKRKKKEKKETCRQFLTCSVKKQFILLFFNLYRSSFYLLIYLFIYLLFKLFLKQKFVFKMIFPYFYFLVSLLFAYF